MFFTLSRCEIDQLTEFWKFLLSQSPFWKSREKTALHYVPFRRTERQETNDSTNKYKTHLLRRRSTSYKYSKLIQYETFSEYWLKTNLWIWVVLQLMKSNVKWHHESEDCEVYFTLLNKIHKVCVIYPPVFGRALIHFNKANASHRISELSCFHC